MIQVQSIPEITSTIERLNFHVFIQSNTGNIYAYPILKPLNFMERVFSELAMREGEKMSLNTLRENGHTMCVYQHFSFNENVYVQVFANKDPDYVWIQKIRPTMNNFEILGVKNQKRPVNIRIEPNQEKAIIIQQVNAKSFQFVGGQGDFMLEKVQKS